MLRKRAVAFLKAARRESRSDRSALTTSAPAAARAKAAGEEGVRVRMRTCQVGRGRKVRATEEPWVPVAPVMTMIFLLSVVDMLWIVGALGDVGDEG